MGTLRVDGDLLLAPDSVFELEVDAEGNSDLVEVSGTAQLDGDVLVLASGGDYQAETEYTFLRAEGGIEGRFDDHSSDVAFLVATLDYNANDVRLILSRNGVDFADIANTRNQRAAAGGVETLGPGSTLYDRVLTYGADDAQAAFDELSGEIYASTAGTMLTSNQVLSQSMNDRVAAAFAQLGRSSAPGEATGLNFWSSAAGGIGVLEGNGNAEDTRFSAGNLFVGADAMFNNQWIFGAVAGLGHTGIAVTERSSSATVDNYHLGVYGGGEVENFTVKFGAGVSGHSIDTRRSVTTPGFAEQLFSTRGAATGQFFGELGHKFTLDSGLVLEPFVNLSHASLFLDDFDEKGETAALAGGSTTRSLTQITLGLRGETTFDVGEIQAKASAMVGWRHTLGGVDPTSTHAFSGGGDFTVAGSPIVKDAAVVQAGLDLQLTDALDVGVRYDGQFDANVQQQGIKANLTLQF
jgi:outer membrane autotransporter protein